MEINKINVGELETNCYIISIANEYVIIDPGDEFPKIKQFLTNKKVVGCLVTHFHLDHIGALEEVLSYYDLEINKVKSTKFQFEIINTPGHTQDSKTFYFPQEKVMFCGDFIFKKSLGRTDLGGSYKDMQESLKIISNYPDDIKLYPGHGPSTTLKEEKSHFKYYY